MEKRKEKRVMAAEEREKSIALRGGGGALDIARQKHCQNVMVAYNNI